MAQKVILGRIAQTRARMTRYTVTIALLLVFVCVLQVSVFTRWRFFGAVPDLCLGLLLCISYFCGKETGAITGIAGGFLIEAIGSEGVVLLPVIYLFCGYLCGYLTRVSIPKRFPAFLIVLGMAMPVRAVTTVIYACLLYRHVNLPSILGHAVLPELFGTFVCACAMYYPVKWICGRLNR